MKINIGRGTIEIIQGDITEMAVDAVVNAANNHLWMGAGVAGAIKKKGGQQIENEAVALGPVEIGGAVITTGGNLPAKFVVHAAGMGQDLQTDDHKVRKSTLSSLELAEEKQLNSIAFPAVGTGVGGLDMHLCAKIMLNESLEFLIRSQNLRDIKFVLFEEKSFTIFCEELRLIFSAK